MMYRNTLFSFSQFAGPCIKGFDFGILHVWDGLVVHREQWFLQRHYDTQITSGLQGPFIVAVALVVCCCCYLFISEHMGSSAN